MSSQELILTIKDIIDKAANKGLLHNDRMSLLMDLECVAKEFDTDLKALLDSNELNFAHDINGIQNNLDRRNKRLVNHFIPRFLR